MSRKIKRLVVKVGTSLLTRDGGHLDSRRMTQLVARELAALRKSGIDVLLVTSGAIAAGLSKLGLKKRPQEMGQKQAVAAVGQIRLMEAYRQVVSATGRDASASCCSPAKILRTGPVPRTPRATLTALLQDPRSIPIINENDTVAVEEIRLGDNDTLAALVAVLVRADLVVLLTDVEGLMTRPPHHGKGELDSSFRAYRPPD